MSECVYRIVTPDQWQDMQRTKRLPLSPIDVRDGYIHLSFYDQVRETANRYFQAFESIYVLAFPMETLGVQLKIESVEERGGHSFPHFYGEILPSQWIENVYITRNQDASFGPLEPLNAL